LNATGQTVFSDDQLTGNFLEINTSKWNNGVYIVNVFDQSGSFESYKVVKM